MLKKDEEIMIIDELRAGEEGEWITSLSIVCSDLGQADRAFAKLSATALDLSHDSVSQMVSKHKYDTDDDEEQGEDYHDDQTLVKVLKTLHEAGYSMDSGYHIMNMLLNVGIVFRERR